MKASTDVLDYLRSLGVDRVACMLTLAKANEALFWESQASGTEEGEEDTLSLAQCEATVGTPFRWNSHPIRGHAPPRCSAPGEP